MVAMTTLHLLIFLSVTSPFLALPLDLTRNGTKTPSVDVLEFLKKFGYIDKDDSTSGALYTEDGIGDTIKLVQKFGALEQTGKLDNQTLKLMVSPRCGVPDVHKNSRQKRFILAGDGWKKRSLTFYVANWPASLGEATVASSIQKSLDAWGKYSRLKFARSPTPNADIIVAFGSFYHGDVFPFDGPGNVLAHAYFPYEASDFAGDVHFDSDEQWVDKRNESEEGMDFATVALHELGHALGLSHSPVQSSVMFPYYQGFEPGRKYQIEYDDILGMYELYIRRDVPADPEPGLIGPQTTETSQATEHAETTTEVTSRATYEGDFETVDTHQTHDPYTKAPPRDTPQICDGSFDAVASLRNELFIFKNQFVWRLQDIGKIEPGYPITIHDMFPGLPSRVQSIDAAYQRPDGIIILFTGQTFWLYDGRIFGDGSPRPLSDYGLPENLPRVDAVQTWAKNGKTYFYHRDRFWRYDELTRRMDDGYPRHIQRWRGVPSDLDAATTWKGVTYFFKNGLYWKFDNDWVSVTAQSPLPALKIWAGCPEDEQLFKLYAE